MISELNKSDFYKCNGLVNEKGHMEVKAVIEGVNPGRIFVDNLVSPNSGLIWLGNNDGFFFIGKEDNEGFNSEINNFIDKVIVPEAKKVGLNWFEGIGNHQKWNKIIEKIFEHRKLGSWNQRVYMLENYNGSDEPMIEQGYSVLKISKTLYKNNENSLINIDFLHSKVSEFWSSADLFFNDGIGYCIVHNNKIVCICFSGFAAGNVHCIDIETLEDYRGKKLAQKVAHRFVKDCLENDKVPYWDCMEVNKPSIAVAENIGFTNVFNYVGYDFPFE
ncbi:GNAT family N-acetyltransferase [Heyndrickxia sp. NPDC080065]|uniref:GNAT family N-acetyltransferase n=1 Tax=Heyndrickxia sp. NPDC080065 TaxID=3390568 RepID=UPI003D021716